MEELNRDFDSYDKEYVQKIAAKKKEFEDSKKTMDPAKYTGRASIQVDAFLKNVINPMLEENKDLLGMTAAINV